MKTIDTKQYIEFIAEAIQSKGVEVADIANKLALEMKEISLDQYRRAASLIVDAMLESM